MKITFAHRLDKNNVGDYWCSPIHYYRDKLLYESVHIEIKKVKEKMFPNTDPIIIGGGGLIGEIKFDAKLREILSNHKSRLKVIWGAGDNVTRQEEPTDFLSYIFKFDLVGIRDYIDGYEQYWLPCVSCKSPLFDKYKKTNARNHVVYFEHLYNPLPRHLMKTLPGPVMTNNGFDLEGTLQFLSSGEFVMTNSYHGAYWAQLLGKKVISTPWSTKFLNMKHPIVLADYNDWHSVKYNAENYDVLEEYRERNDVFFQKFLNKL